MNKNTIKAILVDDEEKSSLSLKQLLNRHCPEVDILATVASVAEARVAVEKYGPELVFLDVEMPNENGFKLLSKYEQIPFEVIFTTAYDQYALKAIRFSALDYLMKPIDHRELRAAVSKFTEAKPEQRKGQIATLKENLNGKEVFNRIALPTSSGYAFIQIKEIIRLEADGNYTRFNLDGGDDLMVSKTLKEYEELLSENHFFRTHNSHMINLDFMRQYIRGKGGYVIMTDGTEVEVSARRKADFMKVLPRG